MTSHSHAVCYYQVMSCVLSVQFEMIDHQNKKQVYTCTRHAVAVVGNMHSLISCLLIIGQMVIIKLNPSKDN